MTTATLDPQMSADTVHISSADRWPQLEEGIYLAVTRAWFRLFKPGERRKHPLRRYVLAQDFARTLAETGADLTLVASICARLACRHPFSHDGAQSVALKRTPCQALDPAVAWWRPLDGPDGLGIHYVELGGGTLEFLSVARRPDQPILMGSR